jgi:hypothetical protein
MFRRKDKEMVHLQKLRLWHNGDDSVVDQSNVDDRIVLSGSG